MTNSYGIIVGRWSGPWTFLWYADIMISPQDRYVYASFTAFTRAGALRKAKRYLKRYTKNNSLEQYTYLYDTQTGETTCLENLERP